MSVDLLRQIENLIGVSDPERNHRQIVSLREGELASPRDDPPNQMSNTEWLALKHIHKNRLRRLYSSICLCIHILVYVYVYTCVHVHTHIKNKH